MGIVGESVDLSHRNRPPFDTFTETHAVSTIVLNTLLEMLLFFPSKKCPKTKEMIEVLETSQKVRFSVRSHVILGDTRNCQGVHVIARGSSRCKWGLVPPSDFYDRPPQGYQTTITSLQTTLPPHESLRGILESSTPTQILTCTQNRAHPLASVSGLGFFSSQQ